MCQPRQINLEKTSQTPHGAILAHDERSQFVLELLRARTFEVGVEIVIAQCLFLSALIAHLASSPQRCADRGIKLSQELLAILKIKLITAFLSPGLHHSPRSCSINPSLHIFEALFVLWVVVRSSIFNLNHFHESCRALAAGELTHQLRRI